MNIYPYGIAAYALTSIVEEINEISGLHKRISLRQLSNIKGLINCTLQQISNISRLWVAPKSAKTIDTNRGNWHDESVAAKSATRFGSLKHTGSHAAKTLRFFCACNISLHTFSMGGKGREALRLLVRYASLPTCLLSPALAFGSARRALTHTDKVNA